MTFQPYHIWASVFPYYNAGKEPVGLFIFWSSVLVLGRRLSFFPSQYCSQAFEMESAILVSLQARRLVALSLIVSQNQNLSNKQTNKKPFFDQQVLRVFGCRIFTCHQCIPPRGSKGLRSQWWGSTAVVFFDCFVFNAVFAPSHLEMLVSCVFSDLVTVLMLSWLLLELLCYMIELLFLAGTFC